MKNAPQGKTLILLSLAITAILSISAIVIHYLDKEEIVFVDSIRLVDGYKGTQAARADYESKTMVWKSNLDSLKTELTAKIKDYQSKQSKLSAKEKALTEQLLQSKQQELLSYQQVISEKIQKADEELNASVLARINDFIKKYGESHNYEIIMAATQYGNIVYSKKGKDITEDVLKGLNSTEK